MEKVKSFALDTLQLFKTHTKQVVAIMAATALLATLIVAPMATLAGVKSVLGDNPKANDSDKDISEELKDMYEGMDTWEEYVDYLMSHNCDGLSIEYFEGDSDEFGSYVTITASNVDSLESFMGNLWLFGGALNDGYDEFLDVPHADSMLVSFLDSIITLRTSTVRRGFTSSLIVFEDNPRYADIVRYYNEYFSDTDMG